MTDKARLPGIFHGINFVTKSKGEDQGVTQKVLLAFGADMDAVAQEHILNLIRWSKQPVLLEVSKQQLSLEDGKGAPQADLPGIRPPAAAALEPVAEALLDGARNAEATLRAVPDPAATWFEREVRGPDDIMHPILFRADGKMFACWDCGDVVEMKVDEVLEDEIRKHACKEDGQEGRVCRACGCTDERCCPGGCRWVEPDLCSNPDCLEQAGYTQAEIEKIQGGELPLVWGDRTADVIAHCADGVTRKFEVQITDNRIESLSCDACAETIVRPHYAGVQIAGPDKNDLHGLTRNHRCPDICHKCRAREQHGDALADLLILHRSGCPNAPHDEPTLDGLLYQLSQKSYAQRIREAFDRAPRSYIGCGTEHVTCLVFEDAAEALARIEDAAGIEPSTLRPETYATRGTHKDNYRLKSLLADLKKSVKETKNRALSRTLDTLLEGIKDARKALKEAQDELNKKEMSERLAELDTKEPDPEEELAGEPEGESAAEADF